MALAVGGGAGRGGPQQRRVLRLRQGAAEHGQARQRAGLVGGGLLTLTLFSAAFNHVQDADPLLFPLLRHLHPLEILRHVHRHSPLL